MKSRHEEFIPQEIGLFRPSHPTVRADLRGKGEQSIAPIESSSHLQKC